MKDLDSKSNHYKENSSKELISFTTLDGTLSLRSNKYRESFHCETGARKEATEKFLNPAEISQHPNKESITVLDVCFGIGYNTGVLLEPSQRRDLQLKWWGLEIDKRPLQIALKNKTYRESWSSRELRMLDSINSYGYWNEKGFEGEIIWGDARKGIKEIPINNRFDLIMLDAFSPVKCPELWSAEFLVNLSQRLAKNGRLITYSSAASIRKTLRDSGLEIMSLLPITTNKQDWTSGTIGIFPGSEQIKSNSSHYFRPLTIMEEEHLKTRASVPYRDPSGNSTSYKIHKRREAEQKSSSLKSTNSWKKKWINA
ncbi:MnmC family methyltransferase [Prochlorococcus marinus]|uniref:MnmC family methyltransferase n=1 Tax=Prochlorococcus marinus TaxID=1219 RepID=UPI0022B5C58C|nr:MnmC family methyltransferase [Prochlorococcus marinus]